MERMYCGGMTLSRTVINMRLIEWRNLKKLHQAARERMGTLLEKNKELQKRLATAEEKVVALEEELRRKNETVEKLQQLLFERKQSHGRIHRERARIIRDTASYHRALPTHVDLRKEVSLKKCPDCGGRVSCPQSSRTRIIEDIVLTPQTIVTEWTITRHYCTACEKLVEAPVPGILPHAQLGPKVLTLVMIAKYRWNLPYAKIRDVLSLSYGLAISEGEVAHLLATAGALVGEKWRDITEAVRLSKRVHCDETSWWVAGEKAWAHTFSSEDVTLYVITDTRGKGVAEKALSEDFTGVCISDCLANYKHLPGEHQICWAHLTREAFENLERGTHPERETILAHFNALYERLRKETSAWQINAAQRAKQWCEQQVARLLTKTWHDPPSRKLVERIRSFSSALFTCLDHPGLPPDNNEAERALRKLAVQRKISGGNRSWKHARVHAQLMSVIETLRKDGDDLLTRLQTLLSAEIQERLSLR